MTFAAWLVDRFKVVRGSLDGSADKLWKMYKAEITRLEKQLSEARSERDEFKRALAGPVAHARHLDRLLVEEQQAHALTHARLAQAAKRCVKLRCELGRLGASRGDALTGDRPPLSSEAS